MDLHEITKNHWIEIKNALRGQWDKLSDKELEDTQYDLLRVAKLIKEKYPEENQIEESLYETIRFYDFDEGLITPPNEDFYEQNPTAARSSGLSEFQDESLDIKTRTPERSEYEKNARINT